MSGRGGLVERDAEIEALCDALRRSASVGAAVVIEGPAGIGKTRLIEELSRRSQGTQTLSARGGALEGDIAFGLVRQLLEPRVTRASEAERHALLAGPAAPAAHVLGLTADDGERAPIDLPSSLHGLFWLVANLAERRPLLLVADDIQWADRASIELLVFLARRVEGLPILPLAAARSDDPGTLDAAIAELGAQAMVLRPAALSAGGVGELARRALGAAVSRELVGACHSATGGNPFYLGELLAELGAPDIDRAAISIDAVHGAAPSTVRRSILLRLGRLADPAPRLAVAAALLGDGAALRHAAALADVAPAAAEPAADALVGASILASVHPLRFAHPIVRTAIEADVPPARRAAAHRRAAMLLKADGDPRERVVAHLLRAAPAGDQWAVGALHEGAREAFATGAPEIAARHLRRALAEPPATGAAGLLGELSGAEFAIGAYAQSAQSARRAIEAAPERAVRAAIRHTQAYALIAVEGAPAALRCLEQGIEEAGEENPQLALLLEGELALQASLSDVAHAVLERLGRHRALAGESYAERFVLGILALDAVRRDDAATARTLALRALAGGRLLTEGTARTMAYYTSICALLAAEALDDAREAIEAGAAEVVESGLQYGYPGVCWTRGMLAVAEGRLAAAEADMRACVQHAMPTFAPSRAAVHCSSGNPKIQIDQPVDGDVLKVARVAAAAAGQADTWELKYDAWFCNPSASEWTVQPKAFVSLISGGQVTLTKEIEVDALKLAAGANEIGPLLVRDATNLRFAYPLPERIKVEFKLTRAIPQPPGPSGQPTPDLTELISYVSNRPVAEHVTPGPLRAFFAPFHQSDLPPGQYWSHGRHAESNFQRFGHDLGVSRYSPALGAWTELRDGQENEVDANAAYQIFDEPVYAMADGEAIGCNRGALDNELSWTKIGNVPGGNLLWIRSGDETILYAHLKRFSIPSRLCPFSDDQEHQLEDPNSDASFNGADFTVRAGDYLGRVGASGNSRGHTHLHIHAFRGLPAVWAPGGRGETGVDADSPPMNFIGMAVQPLDDTKAAQPLSWNFLASPAALPDNSIIQGDPCNERSPIAIPEGSDTRPAPAEVVRPLTSQQCFGYLFSVMVQAGYRAVHVEEHRFAVSSVWRRADGTPWTMYRGLTQLGTAKKVAEGRAQGYRMLDFDTHADGGTLRHSLILARQPGPRQLLDRPKGQATIAGSIARRMKRGWRPARVSAARLPSGVRYTVLYERVAAGSAHLRVNLALAKLADTQAKQLAAGRGFSTAEVVQAGHDQLFAGAWYERLSPTATTSAQALTIGELVKQVVAQHKRGRHVRSLTHWLRPGGQPALAGSRQRYVVRWSNPPRVTITQGPEQARRRRERDVPLPRQ